MAVHIPAKRVTGPLDDEAQARLRGGDPHYVAGYASSGTDHGAASCFSGLVHAFFLETDYDGDDISCGADGNATGGRSDRDERFDNDCGCLDEDRDRAAAEAVRELINPSQTEEPFRFRLACDVSEAAECSAWLRSSCGGSSLLRRVVMSRLRVLGYNAGICKAGWATERGLAAGSHEYIDVVSGDGRRYIVELDLAAGFEIARPTEAYRCVLGTLPRVAVAGEEAMRQVVRAVAEAARRSLRSQGLHVPPWRKSRYMLAKWLGPYRRTTNPVPSSSLSPASGDVQCRSVGFPAAGFAAGPAARTR